MAEEKKEIPKHIDTYYKHAEKGKQIVATTDLHHREAYNHAVNKVLIDKKTNLVNYDLLKKSKSQKEFADNMADYYFDKAVTYFGFKQEHEPLTKEMKKDIFKKDMMLRAYSGLTQGTLRELVNEHKNDFTFEEFSKVKYRLIENLKREMNSLAGSHLTDEHIDDILKYTKAEKYFIRDNLKIPTAMRLLDVHKESGGVIPVKDLDKLVGDYDAIKPEYRSDYEPPKDKKK